MKLHLGQGTTLGALTLFPVWNESGGRRRYTTSHDSLAISELAQESVPTLLATNSGRRDVLVPDGQLLEGGLQHRMAIRSAIVPARQHRELQVACVEAGRWGGSDRSHRSEGRRAAEFIRSGWSRGGQAEVWDRVGRTAAVGSATGSYVEMRQAYDLHQAADVFRTPQQLPWRTLPGQAGVLVGIAGQPLLLEVFDDATTLREQFDAIVQAGLHDADMAPPVPTPGRRARRMVRRLEQTLPHLQREPEGDLARSAPDARLDLARLEHQGRAVHLRATDRQHAVVGA